MDLSIIIVSFNTKELLKNCLESIFESCREAKPCTMRYGAKLQRGKDWEIIVVDNGSTDGSVEEIQNAKSLFRGIPSECKMQNYNIKFKIIENKENLGFAKAVNQGIRRAQGKTILLLNSDTQVKGETLERLLEFEKKVGPAIIGPKLLNPDGSVQASVFHLPTIKRAILEFWLGKKGYFSKYAPLGDSPAEVEAVSGGAMLVSESGIDKIGLLDERYFMYFEDLDFCRRARKAGFKIYYLPSAEIVHEHGASGVDLAKKEEQWKRLVPSSKIYHGILKHYLIGFVLWTGQRLAKKD